LLLILPIASFILFYLILREKGIDWRQAALAAAVFWGTCVVVITETLSAPRMLTRNAVAISWLGICVASLVYLTVPRRCSPRPLPSEESSSAALDRATTGLLIATVIIILLVFITAVVASPATWDAMEYHLPRVVMWMSNHSVRFFPTSDYCQLIYGPWAEYAMMHADLLWGGDRFVNLVEFFSMLGCGIGVSLIAKRLGAGLRGQALAAVICATIPEGVLEASGPMNTYVVSFWIVTAVAFLMFWNEDPSWFNTVCVGLAAGLALLTKGTAYIFLLFLVLTCWWMGSAPARIRFLKRSAIFLLLIFALNVPQYLRNYEFSGSPLGLPLPVEYPRVQLTMAHVTVRGTLANVIRNISLHLGTPSAGVNAKIERIVRVAIHGLGANPDDPGAIWLGMPFQMSHFSLDEVHAGNPLHLALLLFSVGIVFWKWREVSQRKAIWYALGIIAAFVFFCAMLRWQMWSSRYHLALFALGSALTGYVLDRYFSRRLGTVVGILLLTYALPFAAMNRTRSLVPWNRVDDVYHPRPDLYFDDSHESSAPANIAAANAVNQLDCRNIAIDSYLEDPEIKHSPRSLFVYPLLTLIHADGRARRVWYTGVDNLTTRFAARQTHPAPCAVICLECAKVPAKWAEYRDVGGRASVFDYIVVFSANGSTANIAKDVARTN